MNKSKANANSSIFFRLFVFLVILICSTYPKASASTFPTGHHAVQVSASVGQFYISLSGYIAPFASVVLTSDSEVIRSVVADASGNFYISQILVRKGFDHFCLTAVDVKRLGESQACFTIPPVTGDYTKSHIFLPPTIGLFRTQIQAGSNAIIWGYSMPGASVTVHASDGKDYTVIANSTGYYQISVLIDKAGSYDLSATAVLNSPTGEQNSEKPTNKVTLIALTLSQQVGQNFVNWLKQLLTFLFNLPLGPLWLGLPILILIFILWRKLQGKPLIPQGKEIFFFDYLFKKKMLHHHWMKGVGY